jgi:type I restriction enzyme S subunit
MADSNTPTPLRAYIDVKHGFAFKGQYFCDEPTTHVLVTPGNFAIGGGFQEGKAKYYNGPVPKDYVLREGDLVVTMTDLSKAGDTLGYPALIPDAPNQVYLHNQRVGLVSITDRDRLDRDFLYYLLRTEDYRNHILATASGSTVRHTSPSRIVEFAAELPPLAQQQAAAAVLRALDDKIDQNRRTSRALEELARATFKAWFVDFEPVKAKAAGAATFPGMPAAAFAALPHHLVDTRVGPVPQGWMVGTMGDIGKQRREQVAPSELDGDTPYIGLEHMPRRDLALSEWGTAASVTSSKVRFRRGDVLFGKLRPYFHKVGPAPLDGVCSTDIVVLCPKRPEYAAWLLMIVSDDDFVAYTDRSSAGTKMPRTNWNDMAAFVATMPPSALASAFQEYAAPMLELITAGILESRALAIVRDYLLPRLLNGRVRVGPLKAEAEA